MANKAQLIDYISENYETNDGMPVSLSKLDSYKKSDLEEFIKDRDDTENLNKWISEKEN